MPETLRADDEQECPRCGAWHRLEARNTTGTLYERTMLYVTCRGKLFFAGTIGSASRYATRPPNQPTGPSVRRQT